MKGQTLIIIVFVMLIALGIGVALSSQYQKTLRMFIITDDASKALAAAEAATEKILAIPNDTLAGYIQFNNCGSVCTFSVVDTTGQTISANVSLSYAGNSSGAYEVNLIQGETGQMTLTSYPTNSFVDICWDTGASVFAGYIYKDGNDTLIDTFAYNSSNSSYTTNHFSNATANNGHLSCYRITTIKTPLLLRLQSFYSDTPVYILPAPNQIIPTQGIYIQAEGRSGSSVKKVRTLKTDKIAPSALDYVLFQKSEDLPLTNKSQ